MSWVDFALLAVVAVSVVLGLVRGFIREALSLVVWASAFWLALHYTPPFSDVLTSTITTPWLRLAVAFAGLFIATLLIGGLLVFLCVRAVHNSGLGGVDRVLGVGFGLIRGLLMVAILVFMGQLTPFTKTEWWQGSALISHMQDRVGWLRSLWPDGNTGETNGGGQRHREG